MREDENEIFIRDTVKLLISDFQIWGISNFGDWLLRYDDTIDEVLGFIETYCDKISREDFKTIEEWEKVVMLNSLALYMIELDINFVPEGNLRNEILYRFVQTIRTYTFVKKGLFKANGEILISKNCEFVKQ